MEGEILCPPAGDALIIADKAQQEQHPEKTDGNVAQKIQAECDKQFHDSHVSNGHAEAEDAPLTNGNADAGQEVESNDGQLQQNGDQTTQQAEKHEGEQRENKEKPEIVEETSEEIQAMPEQQEENHQAPENPATEGRIPMDSVNINEEAAASPEIPKEVPRVEIVEAIEKVEKMEEAKPETPEPVQEPMQVPEIIESPVQETQEAPPEEMDAPKETVEKKLQNGLTDQHVEEVPETVEPADTVPSPEEVKAVSPAPEEPIKGHYQPEQIENFGISVRDMVNDMPRIIEDEMKAPKESMPNAPRKGAIATSMDTESVRDAYNDIRADNSETMWAVFKYEASRIVCAAKGVAFDEFKKLFDDDERAYGYIRLQTGDEMSKRYKFLFVTWIGPGVSVLKRAKMSIDKAIIKNVVSNFAVELQLETQAEFDLPFFIESLNKASGANYGTGVRDI